jgi:hypothetical protein
VLLDGLVKDGQSSGNSSGVKDRAMDKKRKTIIKNCSRGHKLFSMVKKTGFGILLLPDIW